MITIRFRTYHPFEWYCRFGTRKICSNKRIMGIIHWSSLTSLMSLNVCTCTRVSSSVPRKKSLIGVFWGRFLCVPSEAASIFCGVFIFAPILFFRCAVLLIMKQPIWKRTPPEPEVNVCFWFSRFCFALAHPWRGSWAWVCTSVALVARKRVVCRVWSGFCVPHTEAGNPWSIYIFFRSEFAQIHRRSVIVSLDVALHAAHPWRGLEPQCVRLLHLFR